MLKNERQPRKKKQFNDVALLQLMCVCVCVFSTPTKYIQTTNNEREVERMNEKKKKTEETTRVNVYRLFGQIDVNIWIFFLLFF